jgi:hypothetical protein
MALLHGFVRHPWWDGSQTGCSSASWIISSRRRAVLYVDEALLGTVSLQIINAEGVRQIVTLRDPLMLPRPAAFPK